MISAKGSLSRLYFKSVKPSTMWLFNESLTSFDKPLLVSKPFTIAWLGFQITGRGAGASVQQSWFNAVNDALLSNPPPSPLSMTDGNLYV